MKTSVLIATRKDPDLRATVDNLRHNSGCHVQSYEDTRGMGPQWVRHKLISESNADVVIVMDGHMRVKPGTLDAAAEYVGQRGNKVACLRCFHSEQEDWTGTPYAGASLQWGGKGKDVGEPQAFVAKWRKSQQAGKIGAVMGACYVMRRDWYLDGLRAPWQWGQGWGCDEELISAATWLRGGEVELLPWAVWHRAQSAKSRKFSYSDAQLRGVWANRLALLQALPMPTSTRNKLIQQIMPAINKSHWRSVAALVGAYEGELGEYRAFLASGGLSWDDFEKTIMERETVKKASMMELREQAKAAGLIVPFGCKKVDLQDMLNQCNAKSPKSSRAVSAPVAEVKPPKPPRANWGANEWTNLKKRECVHCGGLDTEVVGVRQMNRLVIRQRKCRECLKPFPTREVFPK